MAGIKDLKPEMRYKYDEHMKKVPVSKFKQGYYHPIYPEKYKTNTKEIIFRSSWEEKLCKWFDLTEDVIEWASEPVQIKYFYIVDNKIHTYYPDFYFAFRKQDGTILKYIVEVKPTTQLMNPEQPKRRTPKALNNYKVLREAFLKNTCKRKYAEIWCKEHGYKFVYVTEKSKLNFL